MVEDELRKALQISEARYRRLFETAQDGVLLLNSETGQIEDANPFLANLLGYSHDELLGKKIWEIGELQDTLLDVDAFTELKAKQYIRYDDLPLATKDGRKIAVEFVSNVYDVDGVSVIQCNIRDITARHLSAVALRATARSLRIVSESNAARLGAKSEKELLTDYCKIVVEAGGYRMAWVGSAGDGPDKPVVALAHWGLDDGYLDVAEITWADTPRGNGPVGRALRDGKVQFVDDIATDPIMAPWRETALRRGYRSCIAVPFRSVDFPMACLIAYGGIRGAWSTDERKLLQETAADLAFGINALRTGAAKLAFQESLRVSLEQTIMVLSGTIAERDSYTAGHQRRVAAICVGIAEEMGMAPDRVHGLHLAAMVHDLGKIGIPAEILSKPGRLSATEFSLIKEHAQIAFDILKDVAFPWPIAKTILQHHERIDGSGYPQGLKGDEILLEAKVLAVADVIEAMASHRPYRPTMGLDAALDEITTSRGVKFDPGVVDAAVRLFREMGFQLEP